MALNARRLQSAPVYLLGAGLVLAIYGFLFPALNWPDEFRNVQLLQRASEGGYAFLYGHFANSVVAVANALFDLNELGDVRGVVQQSSGFQMINGDLRYRTVADVPAVYYFAKFANLMLAGVFAACMVLYLSGARRQSPSADSDVRVFLLSLCFPSVAYGVMQISTDILFTLFSLVPFFLRSRAASFWFALLMALLVVEDRGFLLLSAFVLLREFYGALLLHRIAPAGWGKRLGWLLFIASSIIAAAWLASHLFTNAAYLNRIFPGLGDGVALALEYTHIKSYNIAASLVIFYAGFILMPGATEFFAAMLPLYLLLLFAAVRFLAYCLSGRYGEEGDRAFIALLSVLTVFFFLTGVVHVFESGRYYLYLVPYLVHALLAGALRLRGTGVRPEWAMQFGFTLIAVGVTLLAYLPRVG
ncbi:MAG: hypothetical protein Q7U91_16710 [Sideroxyarcus sp.]|nr:hypothetical protein [Sideroxyarcus sp.]